MLSKLESRKECMEQIEIIQHWNYFCSLAERLDDTKHYIDHGLQEYDGIRELVHGKVYSDIFKQIIVLAASEFEIMSKALCGAKGVKTKRIGDISETILGIFPKIIDFEVSTPFWINTPLHDWKTTRIDNGKNVKVEGLDWWFAYNSIKHDEKESIKNATLENAVLALASLYIIEIYLMKELFGNMSIIYTYPTVYFKCKYLPHSVSSGEGLLPDEGGLFSFPVFGSKCAPVQHMVNILCAVTVGPWWALAQAFIASLIRNLLGLGSPLAFPGSMCGALLGGLLYKYGKKLPFAYIGEVVGTGILGGMLSYPVAYLVMGNTAATLFMFVVPFLISTCGGTIIAIIITLPLKKSGMLGKMKDSLEE